MQLENYIKNCKYVLVHEKEKNRHTRSLDGCFLKLTKLRHYQKNSLVNLHHCCIQCYYLVPENLIKAEILKHKMSDKTDDTATRKSEANWRKNS